MSKKFFVGALLTTALWLASGTAYANQVVINGVPLPPAVDTSVINGATYVPFRVIVETLEGRVDYLPQEKAFIGYLEGTTVKVVLGAKAAYVDGVPWFMGNPAISIDGVAMVPIRFMGDVAGLTVKYDAIRRTVSLSDGTVPAPRAVVEAILSGDTIYVSLNNGRTNATVKLQGMYVVRRKAPSDAEKALEKVAVNYLKTNLLGKTVYLEKDVMEADAAGNLLRYVWIEKIRPGNFVAKSVNAEMVKLGLGRVQDMPPDTKYLAELKILEEAAKRNNAGYWGLSGWSPIGEYYEDGSW